MGCVEARMRGHYVKGERRGVVMGCVEAKARQGQDDEERGKEGKD